jgi:UDP-glucose 4-epimerase
MKGAASHKTILVTGGAGYVGSHMVKVLLEHGHDVVVVDDLSSGFSDAVVGGRLVVGNIRDASLLTRVFESHAIDSVMHFAGCIQVGESVANPAKYYANNLVATLTLLDVMIAHGVRKLVFSSSAAIFGVPIRIPIDETHPKIPINPYGRTKWIVEQALADYDRAYGLKSVSLRYFNAAGADPDGRVGERHAPETHLIPLVLAAVAGRRPAVHIHGNDYDTPDGTCIRDYVHVVDLCRAHLLALAFLDRRGRSAAFNLGNGEGYSVREVIATVEAVTGRRVVVGQAPRRPGDPARLVADATLAFTELGWSPRYPQLDTIVDHAWRWHRQQWLSKAAG